MDEPFWPDENYVRDRILDRQLEGECSDFNPRDIGLGRGKRGHGKGFNMSLSEIAKELDVPIYKAARIVNSALKSYIKKHFELIIFESATGHGMDSDSAASFSRGVVEGYLRSGVNLCRALERRVNG